MKGRRKIETRRNIKTPSAKKSALGTSHADGGKNSFAGASSVPRLPEVEAFSASLPFDRRLYRHDIRGSIAHAQMLAKVGLITAARRARSLRVLREIEREITDGHFRFDVADEDIHLAIERRLIEKIGAAGAQTPYRALAQRSGRARPAALSARRNRRSDRADRRTCAAL